MSIENWICMSCDLPVSYDENDSRDDVGRRYKPYCTNKHEHVDWRAVAIALGHRPGSGGTGRHER